MDVLTYLPWGKRRLQSLSEAAESAQVLHEKAKTFQTYLKEREKSTKRMVLMVLPAGAAAAQRSA